VAAGGGHRNGRLHNHAAAEEEEEEEGWGRLATGECVDAWPSGNESASNLSAKPGSPRRYPSLVYDGLIDDGWSKRTLDPRDGRPRRRVNPWKSVHIVQLPKENY